MVSSTCRRSAACACFSIASRKRRRIDHVVAVGLRVPQALLEQLFAELLAAELGSHLERAELQDLGLLDRPSAPLLGVNGKLDDQAPVADIYLLLEHGNPKSARIYPNGHHMGRTPGMPESEITDTIVDWLAERVAG